LLQNPGDNITNIKSKQTFSLLSPALEAKGDTLSFHILLAHTTHHLGDIDEASFAASTHHLQDIVLYTQE
jgi:hypothetical protein